MADTREKQWEEICEQIDALDIQWLPGGEPPTYEGKATFVKGMAAKLQESDPDFIDQPLFDLAEKIERYEKRLFPW